ncbi:hypothetical protein [Nostoc sp.]|uniref:hypothetical protein n=1 Tax=Nostoc sp. TaxID=1180 RepID=UPI002FF65AE4
MANQNKRIRYEMRLFFRKKPKSKSTQIGLTVENPTLSKLLLSCDCLHQPAIFFYLRFTGDLQYLYKPPKYVLTSKFSINTIYKKNNMYLKKVLLENVGPINYLDIDLPFNESSQPKPVIIVGEKGSGKSIFISYIVNAIIAAQQEIFDNSEVQKGKVYKYRSPHYIKIGSTYSFGKIEFEEELTYFEWQLNRARKEIEAQDGITSIYKEWNQIPENDNSFFFRNFNIQREKLEYTYNRNSLLYFPPNRFEEPAWLNWDNLNAKASFSHIKQVKGFLNRQIINYAPLKNNQNWLFDLIFDRSVLEIQITPQIVNTQLGSSIWNVITGYKGDSTNIYITQFC